MKLGALLAPALAVSLAACGNSQPAGGVSGLGARPEAARFLTQATFGPSLEEIDVLAANRDYEAWLTQQRAAPASLALPYLRAQGKAITQSDRLEAWWRFAVTGPDQLRQRMAFALSEIIVVSEHSPLGGQQEGVAYYYDLLSRNALGNFRDLLTDVTLSPAMGHFLSMWHNQKPSVANGIRADENYAREVMQLFTIGLVQLNLDGTPKLDANGRAIPTFSQSDVANLARVFTGWSWGGGTSEDDFNDPEGDWTLPMQAYQTYHDVGSKVIVGNTAIPAGMQAAPELDLALDTLFLHPNVGPFLGKQLIQRFVTSNPSPAYVERVAKAFDDNGAGVRGDLFAVARAILLDPEARTAPGAVAKLREPILRPAHLWRAFHAHADNGRYEYLQAQGALAQSPLGAASVFNFFRPDFRPIGVFSHAGLVAPEFGITTEAIIATVSNEMRRVSGRYRSSLGRTSLSENEVQLDFIPWESRAAHPEQLLDDLNLVLMCGQMPQPMRQTLLEYIGTIPEDHPELRISEALYLIVSSPPYAAQC